MQSLTDVTELARKLRTLEIRTRRSVVDLLSGGYRSVFRGRGMELDQLREYVPGDDVRAIDWNVTARTGAPHVKLCVEERQMTMVLAVDLSASGELATIAQSKREAAIEIAATLAFSALEAGDRVGLLLFTDRVEHYVPPGRSRNHILRLLRDLLSAEPEGRGTDVVEAARFMQRRIPGNTVIFLISDLLVPLDEELRETLATLGARHDVVALRVRDAREDELPDMGRVVFEDAETGEMVELDTAKASVRDRFAALATERGERVHTLVRRAGVDPLDLRTDEPPGRALGRFFRGRRAS